MRAAVCAFVAAIGLLAEPASAQTDRAAAAFWKKVQATCDATAAKPPGEVNKRIAQAAIDEFSRWGGHRIDANGRLFHFGLTEAEHEEDDSAARQTTVGHLGWWQVMKYWRVLFDNNPNDKLEILGYRDASAATQDAQGSGILRSSAARMLKLAESVADPEEREILREAALRAAVVDTSWSAAFVSYVVRQGGADANSFRFANAHRVYIYDAFVTSLAEVNGSADARIYRACPIETRPRPGDLICHQRESALADATDAAVRERIRGEIAANSETRTVRRTHCDVVAHVDARARKVYTVGGNVNQSVTVRKQNLKRGLRFAASQKGRCGGKGEWTLPQGTGQTPRAQAKCSLNDRKWFVLLQVR